MNITTSASCSMPPAIVALRRAGELAQHENRDLQLLRQPFQAAGNAGDLLLTVAEAAARGEELQVIHDQQRKPLVALEAARLGSDFENRIGARIVDPERRGGNGAERFRHVAPILLAEMAGAELVGVNLRDC